VKSMQASNAAWLAPGCRLDRYDLLLQVAEGGMALLWLARQQGKHGFDRIVAIKTISPKLGSDAVFQRMFLDEARVVSRIEHPNVAHVLDLGEERGVLFLVMEWVDGESLINVGRAVERKTDGKIPVGILARIMVDACAGLQAAHDLTDDDGLALGVVHRDVSPHNLIVGFRGTTKVIDFGIAKARNRAAQDTGVGIVKGKIAYMAPEQAMESGVDRRTDVWSVAASMYRYLAGAVPYSATEPVAMLRRIVAGLPAKSLPTTVPEPIRLVVERALEHDPKKRFETARDLGVALETAMRAADIHTSREDVAAFMEEHLGAAHAARSREIEGAVRESRARMRVESAPAEVASEAALLIAQNDMNSGSITLPADWSSHAPGLAGGSEGPSRPSRLPTAILAASKPSIGAGDGSPKSPRVAVGSAPLLAGMPAEVAVPNASITVQMRARRLASRPLVQWSAGSLLLSVVLAVGFAGHSGQPSLPSGAADRAASPTLFPGPPEPSMSPPSGTPAVQATVSTPDPTTPDPTTPEPPTAHRQDQRASATPQVEPKVPDRGSANDLLERARHARRAGRIDDAASLFAALVAQAPADSEALTGLAEVDEAQGATAKAIANYRRALAVNAKYLPARLGLADSLWTSGQRDEARTTYRSIVDQVPAALCPDLARERAGGNGGSEMTPK
jgi:serine/threonine-protein kinase